MLSSYRVFLLPIFFPWVWLTPRVVTLVGFNTNVICKHILEIANAVLTEMADGLSD